MTIKEDVKKNNKVGENDSIDIGKEENLEKNESGLAPKKDGLMTKLIGSSANPPQAGDLVEGQVSAVEKAAVYVDLPPFGAGIIYGREYQNARDLVKKIQIGDKITAKVVDAGNENGYIELSLREARQALVWNEAEVAIKEQKVFELPIKDANKGGLIIEWQGIVGFLPASQLKSEHYPRVEGGDKDKILDELKKLVGTRMSVAIITALPKEGKLIFSEKTSEEKEKGKMVEKYSVGDELAGVVTGIVDFGVFIKLEDNLEGLVHISEIDWGLVEDPRKMCKVGDHVKVKVIEVKDGKVSLSIKALKPNPWIDAATKYKKGDTVKGIIIKYNKHGALASIEEGVAGLVHISEFGGSEEKLRAALELGKGYDFKIALFDAKEMKMALSFAEASKKQ
ncbi:MAG: RNA binding S1 domain protein [Parcubacteria group bacterium GW2011_GWA2_47_21]|nr:MAG: RNA binding S1 domain protein [Parcubacteria group bacterium GW2011_GWA2_47_21]